MKTDVNQMERMVLGEKGVGILGALGFKPSDVQRHLDEIESDERRRKMLKNSDKFFEFLNKNENISQETVREQFRKIVLEDEE